MLRAVRGPPRRPALAGSEGPFGRAPSFGAETPSDRLPGPGGGGPSGWPVQMVGRGSCNSPTVAGLGQYLVCPPRGLYACSLHQLVHSAGVVTVTHEQSRETQNAWLRAFYEDLHYGSVHLIRVSAKYCNVM